MPIQLGVDPVLLFFPYLVSEMKRRWLRWMYLELAQLLLPTE